MTQDDEDLLRQVRQAGSTNLAFHLAFNPRPKPSEEPSAAAADLTNDDDDQ